MNLNKLFLNARKNFSTSTTNSLNPINPNKVKLNTSEVNLNSSWVESSDEKIDKVLICLHGLFGNSNNWRRICYSPSIRDKRRSLCVDLRNHGDSDHHISMKYSEMAEDVIRHADSLGISKFTVLGHSMGGKVAMALSTRFSDRIDGIVIVDSAPKDHSDDINIYGNTKEIVEKVSRLQLEGKSRRKILEELKEMFNGSVANLLNTNFSYVGTDSDNIMWRSNIIAIRDCYDMLVGYEHSELTCDKPATVIFGEKSHIFPLEIYRRLYPNIKDSDVSMIAGAGHWVHADKPDEVCSAIANFLDRVDNSRL